VMLKDRRTVDCDVFLTATGIRPNAALARLAGVAVGNGVLVDNRMQTSVPRVFAAGDVAEHRRQVLGLWPIATEQAQVAAINALGGHMELTAQIPATILKGVGLELFSIGRVNPEPHDDVIAVRRPGAASYRRLVLSRGHAVGATVLGHHPGDVAAAQKAVRDRILIGPTARAALRSGDWSVLCRPGDATR
jgi:nitrite reductase (NADH) large subunit